MTGPVIGPGDRGGSTMAEKSRLTVVAALSDAEAAILDRAEKAAEMSYCPYSNIAVGAAIAASSGAVYTGTNVENSSYGLTLCAERSAVASAVASGERRFTLMAITSRQVERIVPCGACLQTLAEFSPDMRILIRSRSGGVYETRLSDLLPEQFSLNDGDRERLP